MYIIVSPVLDSFFFLKADTSDRILFMLHSKLMVTNETVQIYCCITFESVYKLYLVL